ncbi:DUF4132 domain-containing protein [Streptomyces cylindrosporus]|uniref:DUF4132 domain-containing protein n=1 Tax=Streptomyces cylindrosporus TaxID=2927583 RepID=A0ABS9Y7C5_9ACTN|nr:DUF4132 domain-containing protein [Streptomyces cylindrosporus]MCI3272849.1 DUF4132 domain-containing protein [Streptomyces cylindrosporus]
MTAATRLTRLLNDPEPTEEFRYEDVARLSDQELGDLLPTAYGLGRAPTYPATLARHAVEDAGRERQPRYTPEACRRMFEALLAGTRVRDWADLTLGAGALVRCTGPWPELSAPARALAEFILAKDDLRQPYALLAVAGLAGEETLRAVTDRLGRDAGPVGLAELAVITRLTDAERMLLSEAERDYSFTSPPPHPDAWRGIADSPAYAEFARAALGEAADRADALHAGKIPYRADKAFTDREVAALGHAARVALLRDEPWLPALLDRLLPGITLAPTAARTVPSQALLYELARAAQDFPTPEMVTALRHVRTTVRHAGVPKQLAKMLKKIDAALAERTDVALRLPALGFEGDGVLRREAGEYAAVVRVDGTTAELTWEKDGRPLRAVPAPVRRDHPDLVKELRDLAKRVGSQLATLVRALEGGYTVDAVHPYGWWRTGLATHPLARSVVRRLIWEVEIVPGDWRPVLPETDDLPDAPEDAAVRLWHPLRSDPDAVRAWRDLLTERRIRQPFKQAFREIYLLTPAEETTRTYSNRFAAHLVHYRRMFALFRARGWRSNLLGHWSDGEQDGAVRTLGAGEWQVRFLHSLADWDGDEPLASTDQVRFSRRVEGAWREAPLAEVPPLVFSEAMRDVDLFVGVTSVAADPEWADGGPVRAYWERAGFAELTASAEARRDALGRILPRLKIAGRCSLDGRFLVVRGELRTYRIHLGSANILMEPDDSYLCIVPARGKGADGKGADGKVFLPFEDERLSLILSKAFLLADDTRITDASILAQIGRGA